jgi:hypothetical protein
MNLQRKFFSLLLVLGVFMVTLAPVQEAEAVSQWSRKYKVECSTCHIAFPRLSFFGEQFMRNGFQWPGQPPDGDETGKEELSENLLIDTVGNWFGARLSLTPLKYKTNARTRNQKLEDTFDLGNTNWLQFFVAGSIFKDVSIFIEQEFENDSAKFSWFHLLFTNLLGTYANLQVGKLSPVEFTSFSDRLRIWQKSDILNVSSSGGAGENSTNVRSARPAIQYYGYSGPLVWFAGVDNGKDATDTDNDKNVWGGFRLEIPDTVKSYFVGSNVSYHYYSGQDTVGGVGVAGSPTFQIQNDFTRHTVAGNIRFKENIDFQAVYQFGRDDNYFLTAAPGQAEFQGYTLIGSYRDDNWWYVLQYDEVNSDQVVGIEVSKISPSIWYFLRDNFKAGLVARFDVQGSAPAKHEVGFELRTMF